MMARKLLALLMAGVLAIGLIACSATTQPAGGATQPLAETQATATEPAAKGPYPLVDKPTTINMLVGYRSAEGQDKIENPRIVWDLLSQVTGLTFNVTGITLEQLPAFLAAGEWPDLFHDPQASNYINDYGIMGQKFVDYNTLFEHMPHLTQTFQEFPDAKKAVTETTGAIYQIPQVSVAVTNVASRFYFRKDNLANAGLAMPTTTEEFYSALKTLKEKTGEYPCVNGKFTAGGSSWFESWLFPAFGEGVNTDWEDAGDGKVVWNRTADQYKNMLKYLNRLYKEGLMHPEFLTLDNAAITALAKEGKATFVEGAGQQLVESDFASGKVEVGVMAPLTSEFTSKKKALGYSYILLTSFAINAGTAHAEVIAKMLDIMYAESEVAPGTGLYSNTFSYGPEGVSWKWTNDDHTEYGLTVPEEYGDITFSDFQYDHMIYFNTGRSTTFANAVTSTPGNNQQRQMGFRDNMLPYQEDFPFPKSFLKFTKEEQAVLDNYLTEINTYTDEMRSKFITGLVDVDAGWEDYVNTLNQMGTAEVLAVYQAAYDRWNGK